KRGERLVRAHAALHLARDGDASGERERTRDDGSGAGVRLVLTLQFRELRDGAVRDVQGLACRRIRALSLGDGSPVEIVLDLVGVLDFVSLDCHVLCLLWWRVPVRG